MLGMAPPGVGGSATGEAGYTHLEQRRRALGQAVGGERDGLSQVPRQDWRGPGWATGPCLPSLRGS